jgi:hypothetical protein
VDSVYRVPYMYYDSKHTCRSVVVVVVVEEVLLLYLFN